MIMANSTRLKVLSMFRKLHRTTQMVFNEDYQAIAVVKAKINEEFRKNTHEKEPEKITELLKIADEAEVALRETVIQAEFNPDKNVFEARVTEDNKKSLLENMPFDPTKSPDRPTRKGKKCG